MLPQAHLLTILLFLNINRGDAILTTDEIPFTQKLADRLLKYYNPSIRPVFNRSTATAITADVSLRQVIDVDEKRQILKAVFWMRLHWKDELLMWDPDDWNGIKYTSFQADKIWIPDMCIYNALKPAVFNNEMQDFFINVHYTGVVNWHAPLVVETFCHFNVKYFPFDTQFCTLYMGSWVYDLLEVDVLPKHEYGDTSELRKNVEWDLEAYQMQRRVTEYVTISASFVELQLILTLKRKPGFYVTYLYIPPVIIILSSLFAFCLPTGSDTKIDLAVVGLLSQTVFLLIISDLMPPDAKNPPLIGECLTMLLIVQASAVIVVVIIKRIHDDSTYKTEPPGKTLLKLMYYLKYPFCLWHLNYEPMKKYPHTTTAPEDEQPDEMFLGKDKSRLAQDKNPLHHPNPPANKPSIVLLVEQIRRQKMKVKYREDVGQLWRNIASMYDRILFVIFVCIIGAISLWFLTLHPTAEAQRE